jgi:hypothetical protein
MADVCVALRSFMLEKSSITSLVGQRMYVDTLVQNATLPAIVYSKISTRQEHTIDDVTRLSHSRIEVRCYGTSRDNADQISKAVRYSGICGFRGIVKGVEFCGTQVDSGDTYESEAPSDGGQEYRYITVFDFMVHFKEAS